MLYSTTCSTFSTCTCSMNQPSFLQDHTIATCAGVFISLKLMQYSWVACLWLKYSLVIINDHYLVGSPFLQAMEFHCLPCRVGRIFCHKLWSLIITVPENSYSIPFGNSLRVWFHFIKSWSHNSVFHKCVILIYLLQCLRESCWKEQRQDGSAGEPTWHCARCCYR